MGLFDGVHSSATVQPEADRVKGAKKEALTSDIYNFLVKYAYATKSKGGAMGINIVLEAPAPEKREIKITEWVTSGDAKGNKTYYEKEKKDANGSIVGKEQFSLPGFTLVDGLCQIAIGKSLLQCASEKRVIKLYNYDTKSEVPTEVDMLVELVGKPVSAAVLNQIQDKTAKSAQTGEYEPTGQVYTTNVVDKFLHPNDRRTAAEIAANIPPAFAEAWLAKWKGQVDDQSTEVKGAGLKGAPVPSGDSAPKASLFG